MRNLPFTSRTVIGSDAMSNPPPWRREGLQPLGPIALSVVAEAIPIMTREAQLALVTLRASKNESAAECVRALKADGVRCGYADFSELVNAGLAKRQLTGFHVITDLGMHRSKSVMQQIAMDYRLHLITEGGCNGEFTARCSCGWNTSIRKTVNGRNALDRITRAHKEGRVQASPLASDAIVAEIVQQLEGVP